VNSLRMLTSLLVVMAFAGSAFAQVPAIGFDIENAQGANHYFHSLGGDQTIGNVFNVVGDHDLTVTHLGAFDMNPDNEPYWDPDNPTLAEHGFQNDHGVALFNYPDMHKLGEVIIPAGTGVPIQDEGYRYLPLDEPVVLHPGEQYVLAAFWVAANIEDGGVDTFYLMGTAPNEIPSELFIHEGIDYNTPQGGCFNPNPTNGPSVDAPFVFYLFWGLNAGGANFLIEEPVAVEGKTWSQVKDLFK